MALHVSAMGLWVGGLAEGSERVTGGNEFVGHVAAEVGGGDASHNAVPLDFLSAIKFVPAGNATGVAASTWCAGPSVYGGPAKGSAAIQGNACFWNIDQAASNSASGSFSESSGT